MKFVCKKRNGYVRLKIINVKESKSRCREIELTPLMSLSFSSKRRRELKEFERKIMCASKRTGDYKINK